MRRPDPAPRLRSVPPASSSRGYDALGVARSAGLWLDEWQVQALTDSLGTVGDKWASFEVAALVPRQNGKGALLEARELAGLFLFGEQLILHSAHEFKVAEDAFRRLLGLIESAPHLDRKVLKVRTGAGTQGIEVEGGGRIRFVARTGGSGRGFSADLVVLDEAYNLPEHAISALLPTMSARPNPQVWYTSSAVNKDQHPNGLVLSRIRRRGLSGIDPSLCFLEWSADDEPYNRMIEARDRDGVKAYLADEENWYRSNPGHPARISAAHIGRELRSMSTKTFAVERLGIGDWTPEPEVEGDRLIDPVLWEALADRQWELPDRTGTWALAFAVDVSPDRAWSSVAVAAVGTDDIPHGEIVDRRQGTGWVVERCAALVRKYGGEVVVDPASPAGSLLADLERAAVPVLKVTGRDYGQACGAFLDAVRDRTVRHSNQDPLNSALDVAALRSIGDAQAWDRKGTSGDLSPLVAFTLALFGLSQARSAVPAIF